VVGGTVGGMVGGVVDGGRVVDGEEGVDGVDGVDGRPPGEESVDAADAPCDERAPPPPESPDRDAWRPRCCELARWFGVPASALVPATVGVVAEGAVEPPRVVVVVDGSSSRVDSALGNGPTARSSPPSLITTATRPMIA
jgi:hypothetical protein